MRLPCFILLSCFSARDNWLLYIARSIKSLLGSEIVISNNSGTSKLAEPGDNKEGYESKDYVSGSKSLTRTGKAADLIKFTQKKQLGLPNLNLPKEAFLTREKIYNIFRVS